MRVWPFRFRRGVRKRGEALPGLHQAGAEPQGSLIFAASFRVAPCFGKQAGLITVERGAVWLQRQSLLALGKRGGKQATVVQKARKGTVRGGVGGVNLNGAAVFPLGIGGAL